MFECPFIRKKEKHLYKGRHCTVQVPKHIFICLRQIRGRTVFFVVIFLPKNKQKMLKVSRTLQFVGAQKSRCYCWEPSQTEGKLVIWATLFGGGCSFLAGEFAEPQIKIVPEADSLFQPQKVDDLNSSVFPGPWGIAERFFSLWKNTLSLWAKLLTLRSVFFHAANLKNRHVVVAGAEVDKSD